MSGGAYLIGVVLVTTMVGALAYSAVRVRRWAAPDWSGPVAWLADSTAGVALLVVISELLGSVGAFDRATLVGACIVVALAVARLVPRAAPTLRLTASRPVHWRTIPAVVALAAVAILGVQWLAHVLLAYRDGIADYDSLWYHLPFGARFAQHGWLTRFPYITPDFPTNFHPANAELLHGTGMLVLGRDALSPLLNLGWATLALLAGWAFGRRWDREWLTLLATAAVLGLPEVTGTQAGTAGNDAASLALVATTAALLVHADRDRRKMALAAAAAGLAIGTKLTLLAPVGVLTIGVALTAVRGRRLSEPPRWCVPLAATGSFWYLRNWFRAGSPIPSLDLGIGPLRFPAPAYAIIEERGFSVLDYATEPTVWREYFVPGLRDGFGVAWPLLLALVGVGAVVAVVRPGASKLERVLGAAALSGGVAYLAMPTSAVGPEGRPILFYLTLRYAAPTLWLGLVLLVVAARRHVLPVVAVAAAVFLGSQVSTPRLSAWPVGQRGAIAVAGVIAIVAVALVAAAAATDRTRLPRPVLAVVALVALAAAGFFGQREHYQRRYDERVFTWVRTVHDSRIGFAGFEPNYPYYGDELENSVTFVGHKTPHGGFEQLASCEAWRRAAAAGDYDYLIVLPTVSFADAEIPKRQLTWSLSDPGLERVLELKEPPASFFRVTPQYRATPCA